MTLPLDYYALLELRRDASDVEVKQAYRKLALQWHPLKNPEKNPDIASQKFRLISEAFDVLSNPQSRVIFDQYGEKGLKDGVATSRGAWTTPYTFNVSPDELFESVFGTTSPFAASLQSTQSPFQQVNRESQRPKLPTQEVMLYVTLEELFEGSLKKVKVTRKVLSPDGFNLVLNDLQLNIQIEPGWKDGTKLTYPGQGNQDPEHDAADLVFTLCTLPHPRFTRHGNHLHHTHALSLLDALCGSVIQVPLLDGRTISVALTDICTPKGKHVVKGEGMPKPGSGSTAKNNSNNNSTRPRGDLIIEFDITFPEQLTMEQKSDLRRVLG